MEIYSGYTDQTAKHIVLDAGAFYRDFTVSTDTPSTAKIKLLGATRGGGEFNAKPNIRNVSVDGVKGDAKGLPRISGWDVNITANMLELTPEILRTALATGKIDATTDTNNNIITAKNSIELTDYINNITWIGTLSGSNTPVIIQVLNALSTEGLSIKTEDNGEAVVKLTFKGHYDSTDLQTPPFKIYYPKIA